MGPGPGTDPSDVNGDGQVTVIDLAIVALFYGTECAWGCQLSLRMSMLMALLTCWT